MVRVLYLQERVVAGGDGEVKDMAKLYLMEIVSLSLEMMF